MSELKRYDVVLERDPWSLTATYLANHYHAHGEHVSTIEAEAALAAKDKEIARMAVENEKLREDIKLLKFALLEQALTIRQSKSLEARG